MPNKSHPMIGGESYPPTQIAEGSVPTGPGSTIAIDWSQITTGLPTTLAGYGITDAYTKTASDARYLQLTGGTLSGSLIVDASIEASGGNVIAAGGTVAAISPTPGSVLYEGLNAALSVVFAVSDSGVIATGTIPFAQVTSTPTTLAGYGITNAVPNTRNVNTTSGDLTGGGALSADLTLSLATTAVTAATYGDATHVGQFTVDSKGRITAASNVAITGGGGGAVSSVFGRTGAVVAASNDYTFAQLASTPTTLSGYGITDALALAGGTMLGLLKLKGEAATITPIASGAMPYTALATDTEIVLTSLSTTLGNNLVKLPTATTVGQRIRIRDSSGTAGSTPAKTVTVTSTGTDTINGLAAGNVVTILANGFAAADCVVSASGVWVVAPPGVPNQAHGVGSVSCDTLMTWTSEQTFSGIAFLGAGVQAANTNSTISGALTLTTSSTLAQYLIASGGDQTVNLPFTGGCMFLIANVGSSNNLVVKYNSGATTLCVIPPGGRIFCYCSNSSPFYQIFGSTNVQTPTLVKVDAAAQVAAISATTLYTTAASGVGRYRVSYSAVITTAATSSSTLGGANGFQVIYTDNDTGTTLTTAAGPTSAANTIGTRVHGDVYVYAKASTALQYAFGYTSSGGTPMAYTIHTAVEFLG
jgi:hypothetical protein